MVYEKKRKKLELLIISLFVGFGFGGCLDTKVSNEEAGKLPVCIETGDNTYTMSVGSIVEVGDYFQAITDGKGYSMYPIEEGQQLTFRIANEVIMLNTRYQELEKGACMEVFHTVVEDKEGNKVLEAHASNPSDYRTLVKAAEYVFKF
ncbi:MAG: hypothetical protein RQ763_11375 [Sulfurimonas sp.]|uniref:hypothetical protein n=1 Tax=Sulfurimonas sp. TaxID=2022749 RepID=UPI0028CE0CB3|nr:hypothetical protein [Sulfurimonas sp.]MDT8339784.1 hypothetical protein [Sulfurimonas sp.]